MPNTVKKDIQTKLARNLLDMIILDYLKKEAMHGYQIISRIRKNFGVYIGPSTVYPLLGTLEKKGYVESAWNTDCERPKRIYKITGDGKGILDLAKSSLSMICKTLTSEHELISICSISLAKSKPSTCHIGR